MPHIQMASCATADGRVPPSAEPDFYQLGEGVWDPVPGNPYFGFFNGVCQHGLAPVARAMASGAPLHSLDSGPAAGEPEPKRPQHVLVAGCGVGGLAAARELHRAGYTVTLVEKQTRAGGRLKTWRAPLFSPGVNGEGGGMRLKGVSAVPEKNHFIVDHYIDALELPTAVRGSACPSPRPPGPALPPGRATPATRVASPRLCYLAR